MEYNITDATFDEETKEGLVLIDFWGNLVWSMSHASANFGTTF